MNRKLTDKDLASIKHELLTTLDSVRHISRKYNINSTYLCRVAKKLIPDYWEKRKYLVKQRSGNKGGTITKKGYRQLCTDYKAELEHDKVVREHFGLDKLPEGYVVHHVDGDKLNNDITNLVLMTVSSHMTLHNFQRKLKTQGVTHEIKTRS